MGKITMFFAGLTLLLLVGCAQRFYLKSNLNHVSIGQTKNNILSMFPGESRPLGAPGIQIRAAQQSSNGKLLEVGEVFLTDGITPTVPYWFLFEDGLLVQWGRPEDWKNVAARYDINFNPSQGVSP